MPNFFRVISSLGCRDVLLALCPGIPHVEHVGGAQLRFLALENSMPLLCLLICLGRPAFCGGADRYLRRGSCRSLRVDMCTSECVRVWVQKKECGFELCCIKESTSIHTKQINNSLSFTHIKLLLFQGHPQKFSKVTVLPTERCFCFNVIHRKVFCF